MAFAARAAKILGFTLAVYPILNYMSLVLPRPAANKRAADHSKQNGAARPSLSGPVLNWFRGGKRVAVACSGNEVRLELHLGESEVLGGPWGWRLSVDGQCVEAIGSWEETCRVQRRRAAYLELALPLAGGRRLERHLLIAPRDGFLFLADAVLGDAPASMEYTGRLPIAAPARFEAADENQEGWLATDRRRAVVVPIALPEWRGDSRIGHLAGAAGAIDLRQSCYGCSLFAPLFIDIRRKRIGKPLTWRRLTVAEERRIQPADRAVGYRVRIGRKQWLIYRSLGPRANRTVLGKNLCTEFLVARFDRNGDTDTILEIE